ncbi:phosphatidylserine synthase [Planoprotostelium fungivorum]|uniref:Phosphatidylserine synthase n=1 Tax=Planoprotostelium fungivorum TaxID=1890364 RepID=A0A2P6NIM9_9EUKA|nr:phosphatidylserine synthase [Planoprotostelium fungivorum]
MKKSALSQKKDAGGSTHTEPLKDEEEITSSFVHLHKSPKVEREAKRLLKRFLSGDPYYSWFEKPHTLTILLLCGIGLVIFAFTREGRGDMETNTKHGIVALCLCYLFYSAAQNRDGLFVRPHPIFWRIVMGCGVLYACLLVFLLFQTAEDAWWLLNRVDSRLGIPLPERSYAENCDIYTPNDPVTSFRNVWDAVNDEFMVAHFFGWACKAILLRDWYLCNFMSILFELLEMSLQHLLPNFAECWWDHWILDVLTMNLFGIILGLRFVRYFNCTPYGWVAGVRPEMEEYNWDILKNWRRLASYVLHIPPPHPINVIRLFLWWGLGLPAAREFYQYVTDPKCKRMGSMCWIVAACAILELLLWIKYGFSKQMFTAQAPPVVVYSWIVSLSLLFVWAVYYYGIRGGTDYRKSKTQ